MVNVILILCLLSIVLAQTECDSTKVAVTILRQYAGSAMQEHLYVYEGTSSTGTLVLDIDGNNMANKLITNNLCLNPVVHTLRAFDGNNDGWTSGSSFTLKIANFVVLTETLNRGSYYEWTFVPQFSLPMGSSWKYSAIAQADSTWTATTYSDDAWTSYTPGTFPATVADTARYYRAVVTLPTNIADYSLFDLGINAQEGIIIYINGQEIYRRNLAAGAITATTLATAADTAYAYRRIVHSVKKYFTGLTTVTIAVEIHPVADHVAGDDSFNGFLLPLYGDCLKRSQDGVASCVGTVINTSQAPAYGFDNNRDTKWRVSFTTGPAALIYQFTDGRREWISKYVVTSADDTPGRDPKDFGFYGSNDDGTSWTLLDINAAVTWTGRKQTFSFLIPSNAIAYNMYKFEVTSIAISDAGSIQIAGTEYYGCNSDIITNFVYEQSAYTWYSGVDEVYLSPLSSGLSTFVLTSPDTLPEGLTFVPSTGEIYGTPTALYSGSFVITAIDAISQQTVTCNLPITILDCSYPNFFKIRVQKTNPSGGTAWSEKYQIYSPLGAVILDAEGVEGQTVTHNLCLPAGIYSTKLIDTDSDAWTSNSFLTISIISSETTYNIIKTSLLSNSLATFKFTLEFLVPEKDTTTLCNLNAVAAPASTWYTSAFVQDENWTPCLSTGSITTNSRVQYFRNTFSVASKTDMNGFEIRLQASNAVVVYLNGQEVYRTNLPDGDVTPETVSTATTISSALRSFTIDPSKVIIGNNVIAIAQLISSTETLPFTDNFIYSVRPLSESTYNSRTWNMVGTGDQSGGNVANQAVDGNYYSRWFNKASTVDYNPVELMFSFTDSLRYEYTNYYCIMSNYDSPQGDPMDWTISGCIDGANCVVIATETGVSWKARSQRQCFFTETHTQSFNSYKFTLIKAQGHGWDINMSFSELYLHSLDYSSLTVEPFAYTPNTVTGYKNVDLSTMSAPANYHKFSILSGTLPAGVQIDSNSGLIYGKPTVYSNSVALTIQAYTPAGTTVTTTVTISVGICSSPNGIFQLYLANNAGNGGNQIGFELLNDATNTRVDYRNNFADWTAYYFTYCQPAGTYKLIMTDAANNGWNSASLKALSADGTQIGSWTLTSNQSPKTVTFDVVAIVDPESTIWTYLNSADIPAPTDNSWTLANFQATGWATGNTIMMTAPIGITQYYRTLINIDDITTYAGFSFSIDLLAGCVAYMNGIEIFRQNMPTGTPTSTTLANADYVTVTSVGGSISVQMTENLFMNGQNVFAIETHRGTIVDLPAYFTASYTLLADNTSMLSKFDFTGANENASATEGISKFFDGSVDSKWLSSGKCVGATVTITYKNERKEFINSYLIANANDCNARHPNGWKIEASNNGETWDLLHEVTGHVWTEFKQSATFDFMSTQAYNKYRWTATTCGSAAITGDSVWCTNNDMQMSELQFYIKRIAAACTSTDGYSTAMSGEYGYKSCDQYYSGQKRKLCTDGVWGDEDSSLCVLSAPTTFTYPQTTYSFTVGESITPLNPTVDAISLTYAAVTPLPSGLTLDTTTGIITGAPISNTPLSQYQISATNTAGSVTATISITISGGIVITCPAEGDWSETVHSQTATLNCGANQTGSRTRFCQESGVWAAEVNTCTYIEPTIVYNLNSAIVDMNSAMTVLTPSVTGYIETYSITPSLPTGITLNTSNGQISGTPSSPSVATTYSITASNPNGSATATVSITVLTIYCEAEGVWTQTMKGQTASTPCTEANMEGSQTRNCIYNSPPSWGPIQSACTYVTPTITLPQNSYITYVGVPFEVIPTVTPADVSYTYVLTPYAPNGLVFDSTTGRISGTPLEKLTSTYTITVYNPSSKTATVSFSLQISAYECESSGDWPKTETNTMVYITCSNNENASRTRMCKLQDNSGVWEDEDISSCITTSANDNPIEGHIYIRFPITITNYNINNIQAKQIDAIRRSLQQGLTQFNIELTSVLLESKSGSTTFFADNVNTVLRVECSSTDSETVRNAAVTYISEGSYINTLRSYDNSFISSTATIDPSTVSVTEHSAMNITLIIIIVVVVVVIIVIIIVVVVIMTKKNGKSTGKKIVKPTAAKPTGSASAPKKAEPNTKGPATKGPVQI